MLVRYIDVFYRIVRVFEGFGQCCNIWSGDGEIGYVQGENVVGEFYFDDF